MSESNVNDRSEQRTSLYLVRRADALLGALQFFTAGSGDRTRRRLQFLTQSDYWEWEIDNLIYSFTNLAERRETWRSPRATTEKLGALGIAVKAKLLNGARWRSNASGRRIGHWQTQESGQRVAPVAMLREAIELWNTLIDEVESEFIAPMRKDVERWNVQSRTDLSSMRKSMPAMDEMEE